MGIQAVHAFSEGRRCQTAAGVRVVRAAHRQAVRLIRAADARRRQAENGGGTGVVFKHVFSRIAQRAAALREIERGEHAVRNTAAAQREQMRDAV